MKLFIADHASPGREALPDLLAHLGDALGVGCLTQRPDRAAPEGLDWIGWSTAGACYGVRWLEPDRLKSELFHLLRAAARLGASRAASSAGAPPSFTLILLAPDIPPAWLEIAPAFAFPVRFFSLRSLRPTASQSAADSDSLVLIEHIPSADEHSAVGVLDVAAPLQRNDQTRSDTEKEPSHPTARSTPPNRSAASPSAVLQSSTDSAPAAPAPELVELADLTDEEKKSFRVLDTLLARART